MGKDMVFELYKTTLLSNLFMEMGTGKTVFELYKTTLLSNIMEKLNKVDWGFRAI